MKKLTTFLLSSALLYTLTPIGFAQYANPEDIPDEGKNIESPLIMSGENTIAPSCPDPTPELIFQGAQAEYMAQLKRANPDLYAHTVARIQMQRTWLLRLCHRDYARYERILKRQELLKNLRVAPAASAKVGAGDVAALTELCANHPDAVDCVHLDEMQPSSESDSEK